MNRFAWAHASLLAVNVGLGVAVAASGRVPYFSIGGAAIAAVFLVHSIHLERKRNGSNRQAQEGARDPRHLAPTFATGGTVRPGTFTISTGAASPGVTAAEILRALGATTSTVPVADEVETVQGDMPILAHRIARLSFGTPGRPFAPLHHSEPFGADTEAKCQNPWVSFSTAAHDAPDLACGCGFYALPSDVEPWDEGSHYVTLMVELSGRVIEHERGYRAQHQRVVECQLQPCRYCGRPAEVLDVRDGSLIETVCAKHVAALEVNETPRVLVAVDDLDLPVPLVRLGRER